MEKAKEKIKVEAVVFADGKKRKSLTCWHCGKGLSSLDCFGCCPSCGTNLTKFPKRCFHPYPDGLNEEYHEGFSDGCMSIEGSLSDQNDW